MPLISPTIPYLKYYLRLSADPISGRRADSLSVPAVPGGQGGKRDKLSLQYFVQKWTRCYIQVLNFILNSWLPVKLAKSSKFVNEVVSKLV